MSTKTRKLTAAQFLAKFPASKARAGLLEDMGCPECGNRSFFKISFDGTADVDDDSSSDAGDHEWNDTSSCRCSCGHHGKVRDFTFKGLDELIPTAQN